MLVFVLAAKWVHLLALPMPLWPQCTHVGACFWGEKASRRKKSLNHLCPFLFFSTWLWVCCTQMAFESPDLNPMEQLCDVVQQESRIMGVQLTILQQLCDAIMSIWTKSSACDGIACSRLWSLILLMSTDVFISGVFACTCQFSLTSVFMCLYKMSSLPVSFILHSFASPNSYFIITNLTELKLFLLMKNCQIPRAF